jgi:hypothetical protein
MPRDRSDAALLLDMLNAAEVPFPVVEGEIDDTQDSRFDYCSGESRRL